MNNPKLNEIAVDGIVYGTMWQDFGGYVRLVVCKNGKRIGERRVSAILDQGDEMVTYLIRRMVGNYGIIGHVIPNRKELNYGNPS
jgi:hypothetical protein